MKLNKLGTSLTFACLSLTAQSAPIDWPITPQEGIDYARVIQVEAPPKLVSSKVEILEFFYFGCGACRHIDPIMHRWAAKHQDQVMLRRVPVAFSRTLIPHLDFYGTLDVLGIADLAAPHIFDEVQGKRNYLLTPSAQSQFVARFGITSEQFLNEMASVSVKQVTEENRKLVESYQIRAVPTVVVDRTYMLTVGMPPERMLQVLDYLLNRSRAPVHKPHTLAPMSSVAPA